MEETLKIILDKLSSMNSDIKDLKRHATSMDSDIKDLKRHTMSIDSDIKDLKRHALVIENEHGEKLDLLFDGYKQLYETQQEIRKDIKDIKSTLNVHEVKLLDLK